MFLVAESIETNSVAISFTEGETYGEPIINYKYSIDDGPFVFFSPPQNTSPLFFTELSPATTYRIRLASVNAVGTSVSSEELVCTTTSLELLLQRLTTPAQNTFIAGFSTQLINGVYVDEPLFKIRNGNTNATTFVYSAYTLEDGTNLIDWLDGAIPYVETWFNQISILHATQTNPSIQPILDISSNQVYFIHNTYLNLPDGTVPYNNSNYTFVVKHGEVNNSMGGFIGSGNYGNTNQTNSFRKDSNGYYNYWWDNDFRFSQFQENNIVAVQYDGSNRYSYINDIFVSSQPSGNRESTSQNNTLGITNFSEGLNGYMSDVCIFSSCLSETDLTSIYTFLYRTCALT
jgi:hypothetical protein